MNTKHSILLVEDEEYIRDLYRRQLEQAGYIVTAVGNGKDALEVLRANQFDLMLLDIMMPDMNGVDVLKALDLQHNPSNMKIVMLTNLGQDNIIKEAFELGATGYLIKLTINPYQLLDEVKTFLEQK